MTSLWPRLEPLLAKVQKPARYIGCEDGALTPDHGPGKVAWLLVYPDTYEIGLPNQGLQILYEILNERDDAVAERAYAPWTRPRGPAAPHGLPLFSVDTHRPAGDFDLIAFNLSAELVLHQRAELHRPGRRPGAAPKPAARAPADRRRRALHLQPRAARRLRRLLRDRRRRGGRVARSPRSCARWKASGRTPGSPRARAARARARSPASTCRRCTTSPTTANGSSSVTPRYSDVPERGREAHGGRPRRLALPPQSARPAHRGRARPAQRRGVPRLHPRLPVLPGGHDHPSGP